YPGTRVSRAEHVPPKIRVGLVQGVHALHLTASGGPVAIRVGSGDGRLIGRVASGSTWTVFPRDGRFRVYNAKGHLVGGHSWGGPRSPLFVRHASPDSVVRIGEAG